MEIKDLLGPAASIIAIVVTILIYSRNNKRDRKKEFSELLAAMERDKETEIKKVKEDAEKNLKYQRYFDEQTQEIAVLKNDIRNHEETHKELRTDLHDIKDVLNQVLQKMAALEQNLRHKTKGFTE